MILKKNTHKNNDEVQNGPKTGEVAPKPERYPFEKHFNGEQRAEPKVGPVENVFEGLVVVQIDVFKAKSDGRGEDKDEDDPLKHRGVHVRQHIGPAGGPPATEL